MTMQEPLTSLRVFCEETLIIPAVRKAEHVEQAIAAHGKIVYLLTGDLENSETMIQKILAAGKLPIVNLDLLNGFSRDKYAVNYLKRVASSPRTLIRCGMRWRLDCMAFSVLFCWTAAQWTPSPIN